DILIDFVDQPDSCGGHLGWFDASKNPWAITMCRPAEFLYEHELAHAWERLNVTDDVREGFMALLGFTNWADPRAPRDDRGVEGVAFVIQQGLGGLPLPARPRAEVVQRLTAFEFL